MPVPSKVEMHHQARAYENLMDFVKHVSDISREIESMPKLVVMRKVRKIKPRLPGQLSPFDTNVAELAPRFRTSRGNRYNYHAITLALLGKNERETDPREVNALQRPIERALLRLRSRKLIPKTDVLRAVKLRDASVEEIKKHSRLVTYFLNVGSARLRKDWRRYLTFDEATEIGMRGLVAAIERFNPSQGKFNSYARLVICGTISNEVTRRARHKEVTGRNLDEFPAVSQTQEDVDKQREDNDKTRQLIETIYGLHKKGKVRQSHAIVFTLRLMGHSYREIAKKFKVNKQAIFQINNRIALQMKHLLHKS